MLDPSAQPGEIGPDGLLSNGTPIPGEEDPKDLTGPKANKGIILRKSVEYIRFVAFFSPLCA